MRWSYGHDRARSALEPFDALIGIWATEATHPLFDAVVPGSTTFEWFEDGHFLVQRSQHDHEWFLDRSASSRPQAGERLVMEYLDSRGVRRTLGLHSRPAAERAASPGFFPASEDKQ